MQYEWDSINKRIRIFYQFKINTKSDNLTFVVPDGCLDVIFSFNSQKLFANCYGTVLQTKKKIFKSDYEYFGVRYLPEDGIFLMKDLIEAEVPLFDIVIGDSFIMEKIANAKSFEERILLYHTFINSSTINLTLIPSLVKYSVNRIYQSRGIINIDQLANETGYSIRYLRKKFEDSIGMPPKLFSEIIRFQNTLSMIIKKDRYNLWDVISENGYYDQSHFINQFKRFSTLTPVKFKETLAKERTHNSIE